MTYILHIANKNYSSWSLRPWVLLRVAGIAFEEQLHPFQDGGNFETFRAFSPTGRVPCLHDGATVVWESLAIADYLAERHSGLWPDDDTARAWARCAAAEMHAGFMTLRDQCPFNCALRVRMLDEGGALGRDIARLSELWEEGLDRFGGPYLAGTDFGVVDAFFAPVAFRMQTYDLRLSERAAAYARRLLALPAMCDWYAAALVEPWREAPGENDAVRHGTLIDDLRAPRDSDIALEPSSGV